MDEDPAHCPTECHAGSCGDGVCDVHENAAICSEDCSPGCGDGACEAGEEVTCPRDCEPCSGDSCVCGDICDAQENWTFVEACLDTCGNGQEDAGETEETCPRDFPGPGCGDEICSVDEDPAHCPTECHAGSCGDGVCDVHENAAICGEDCSPGCGDGACDAGEEVTCPRDCEPCSGDSCVCGDMICGPGESMTECPQDCTEASCGNGAKEAGEACDDGNNIDTDACTSDCKDATCGDGIVWSGEEDCDDGPDNGPGKPCSATCELSACGDGDLGPGETCDDGNDIDTDDCTNACEPAACGDGSVWAGEEECDDGNLIDTDDCTNACENARCGDQIVWTDEEQCDDGNMDDTDSCSNTCVERRVLFVTSAEFQGNLGLIEDIDLKCQTAAMNAGLAKAATFKAWLSDGAAWPAKRFDTQYMGMYVLTDGTNVAENGFADLTDSELLHAVDRTELKTKVSSTPWTNVKADGTPAGENDCNAWTNNTPGFLGGFGNSTATDAKWTDEMGTLPCSVSAPLYCIEDP
ncbi:DUF4215 domain-containing protein [Nannocystis radixulma]|uniref:DUF4215 domain-containing protein n=1 Tax=Nannocystis radixulma TaxID=2995305 RepID=A0ABT5B0S7_9BACT|nr:DUF4215 domain-containing protein [Nannocystis radixulma]MDC0666681.1 DUF4215 domain-containing protein [Nannocystis radixulma]